MVVPIKPGTSLSDPWPFQALFEYAGDHPAAAGLRTWRNYDVSKDGQRFLMVKLLPAPAVTRTPEIIMVQNWFEELKRLVPVN